LWWNFVLTGVPFHQHGRLTVNGCLGGRMFAQRRGSHKSDAAVDRQADDDGQVCNSATDGDRDRLHHVVVVFQ